MATRFLSFLDDVEEALKKEAASNLGLSWETNRIVNYHHGLARMTLTPPLYAQGAQMRGAIFVQSIALADGTYCLKVSFNWHGSDAFPMIPVYSRTLIDWKTEAVRIASFWLAGPPPASVTNSAQEYSAFLAAATLILDVLIDPGGRVAAALSSRWLVFTGSISYGLYLWHYPIYRGLAALDLNRLTIFFIGVPATFAIATLSYRFLERPILNLARPSAWRSAKPGAFGRSAAATARD